MRLLCFIAAALAAVSMGREAVMPEEPPIVYDPPVAVIETAPVEAVPPEEAEIVVVSDEDDTAPTMTYLGVFRITGYDPHCAHCCGKTDGITASGTVATVGYTCAGGSQFEIGTRLYIDGLGERVVEDRGGFPSTTIDVVCEDHAACYAITGQYDVYLIEEDTDESIG